MEISINIFGPNDLSLGDSVKFKKDPKIKGYVINVRERKSFWRKKTTLYIDISEHYASYRFKNTDFEKEED